MEEEIKIKKIEPTNNFFQIVVQIETIGDKGKIKKIKEVHLVDAFDPTQAQKKVEEEMKDTIFDWKIISMQLSKISIVY